MIKKLKNLKVITSYKNKGVLTEIKNLIIEKLLKGKSIKLDYLLQIDKNLLVKDSYLLSYMNYLILGSMNTLIKRLTNFKEITSYKNKEVLIEIKDLIIEKTL